MDISRTVDENNKLLAISSVIQANYRITRLTALLSSRQTDPREGGILDSEALQSDLVNWSYGIEHPFGSRIGMAFGTENLTGEANLKIAFRNHGEFKISTKIWADEYGWSERDQFLQW